MAAAIEVKFFNSYLLKRIKSIQPVSPITIPEAEGDTYSFSEGDSVFLYTPDSGTLPTEIGAGQELTYTQDGIEYSFIIIGWEDIGGGVFKIYLNKAITSDSFDNTTIPLIELNFGEIIDFNYIPGGQGYTSDPAKDWYIEESRIRGGYNNTSTDYGVRAYIVEESTTRQKRLSSLIYSGIFNSRTGVNNTNQFSVAEDITRTLDPAQGSIQKLYSEDTNLIIFQELKVSRALIDKNAIYSAEGEPITTSSLDVIGQVQAYSGNYGISTNPESFAVYGYRKYFVDKNKNVVLRLSQDGITEISGNGMVDYFRDVIAITEDTGKIVGSWDMHNKLYTVSIQTPANSINPQFHTLSFDEDSLGWTSRFSFKPDFGFSLRSDYFTAFEGNIWKHYSTGVPYCNFYGNQYLSSVTVVMNPDPSYSKTFQTVNYEGSPGWALTDIFTDSSIGIPITSASSPTSLTGLENQLFLNNFKAKENKYFGNIVNTTLAASGEVTYGQSISGISGFYMIGTFTFPDPFPSRIDYSRPATLFAVSSTFAQSLSN
jgi:hypothetical protein